MGCNLCFSIISIHAPTRGATYQQVHFTVAYIIFQSTLPREERRCTGSPVIPSKLFQSTLPREERQLHCIIYFHDCDFNPRSHERSDLCLCCRPALIDISIHAPTRGATSCKIIFLNMLSISIHAPTRGATAIAPPSTDRKRFQSTLPREERLFLL